MTKRTDAKQQETRYAYDTYGRVTEVQHWAMTGGAPPIEEQVGQRVNYYYDSNPLNGGYTQNGWGRLAAVAWGGTGQPQSYMYSYNAAGRVLAQRMTPGSSGAPVNLEAVYSWDNEGRMTGINYGPQYTLQYDVNGRLSGMQEPDLQNGGMRTVATASYGIAGEMTGFQFPAYWHVETRQYNAMLQVTRMTAGSYWGGTLMDMQHVYAAGANNGRITQAIDGVGGETVNYTYDAVNRLATAGATNGSWGQAFSYDGFGNLTGKTVTAGSAPTLNVSFNPATNRQVGQNYDANGNATSLVQWGLGYDVENRMTARSTSEGWEYFTYDPMGKRVKRERLNTEEQLEECSAPAGNGEGTLPLR